MASDLGGVSPTGQTFHRFPSTAYDLMHHLTWDLQAEKSLTSTPTKSPPTPKAATQSDGLPKRSLAEIMEDAQKARTSGRSWKSSPEPAELDAHKQMTSELLQDYLPNLMQLMGATDNPIMQASSGLSPQLRSGPV